MSLEQIGFYTLSDARIKQLSPTSPLWRCEVILTHRCNFRCNYCRLIKIDNKSEMSYEDATALIDLWAAEGLKNIRFSGGEPTLHEDLTRLVKYARYKGIERVAISTNGSANPELYRRLVENGANDFSVSLDACCASFGDKMCGVKGAWNKVVENIKLLSSLTYTTVGIVYNDETAHTVAEVVKFASDLGVADIRVISAAQYNHDNGLTSIPQEFLDKHPILKYRVRNHQEGKSIRGIKDSDTNKCYIALDDMAVCKGEHFPCIIYFREGGKAIGKVGTKMREERAKWFEQHDTHQDPICKNNCLDCIVQTNNYAASCQQKDKQ